MNAKTDDLVTRFLLGELSEEDRTRVEERFLADNEFFEEVLAAEDALIDRYLLGQLTAEQHERAENLFRSSDRQRREVSFTEELIASLRGPAPAGAAHPAEGAADGATPPEPKDSGPPPHVIPAGPKNFTPRLQWAGGLALLLACLALVYWIFYHSSQTRPRNVNEAAAERDGREAREKPSEEAAREATPDRQPEIEKEKRPPEKPVESRQPRRQELTASILLAPALLERGGGSETIKLKAGTGKVQLQLQLDEGKRYGRYSVLISTFDGRRVWGRDSLDAGQISKERITLTLPSTLFEYDDYKVELKGLPDGGGPVHVADYVFKVRN